MNRSNKKIRRIIRNVPQHWVGDGFPVRSLFAYSEGEEFDPFLLLDYAGPHTFQPTEAVRGVGEHPHRGFETVTIVYDGELEHRDSAGSHGTIGSGDVQWMTAASGVVHEEFHSEQFTRDGGTLEMVQLWVNLPAKLKMSRPSYQGIVDADIPKASLPNDAGHVRVIAGEFAGTKGAASTHTPINAWDMRLDGEVALDLPQGHTALAVVQRGSVQIGDARLLTNELALFERDGQYVPMRSIEPARILVLTGLPIGEPVVGQGPFVMNTLDEIQQAIHDYRMGLMGRLESSQK
jgi:quercetin 2,3-dioxygenase